MSRHIWSDEEVAILQKLYPDTRTQDIADLLGLQLRKVYSKAKYLGLEKSEAYMRAELQRQGDRLKLDGRAVQFKKGHHSWNKGLRGVCFGGVQTQFKPGNVPHTIKPIGTERISQDGYLQRKVTNEGHARFHYKFVHRIVWEEANGPIPETHYVVFKNGNRLDVRLENLELITRSEHAMRNSIMRYPKEIRDVMRMKGRLTKAIKKVEKDNEKQNG
jgi:hypothetical protein